MEDQSSRLNVIIFKAGFEGEFTGGIIEDDKGEQIKFLLKPIPSNCKYHELSLSVPGLSRCWGCGQELRH